jgi:predicted regulator of Ras-like GTPase activity (Roadblock/LC7/MglB family)
MREAEIQTALVTLTNGSVDIEAAALVSRDGLIIASALAAGMDEARVAAIVAAVLSLGDRMSTELSRGQLEQVLITGKAGHVLLQQSGNHAVLCTIANKAVKLGLLFMDANRAAETITALLA